MNSADFDHLLVPQNIKTVLQKIADLEPYGLAVVNSQGKLLASARSEDIPSEINDKFIETLPARTVSAAPFASPIHSDFMEFHQEIIVEDNKLGIVGCISAAPDIERIITCIELVRNLLAEQAAKEYEVSRMTTELLNKYEELNLLYELSQDLGVIFDIQTICNIALERALEVVKAKKAFIALVDEQEQELVIVAARNMRGSTQWRIPVGQGISGHVAQTGRHVVVQAHDVLPGDSPTRQLAAEASLSVPLLLPATDLTRDKDKVLGVMTLIGKPPGEIFTAGESQLATTIMTQVTVAIHNSRLVQTLQTTERAQQQMEIAARIQQTLLPKDAPHLPGISLAGACIPTTKVGGDYYDYLIDREGHLALIIADASGHSIGSALMIAMARSILRHEFSRARPLDRILTNINRVMLEDLVKSEMFISLFCARYQPGTRRLSFVNAGHNPPLLQRGAGHPPIKLDSDTGLIIGMLDDVAYREQTITLEPGDILLLYTDGIIEARNPAGQQFGETRLKNLLAEHPTLPADQLSQRIYKRVQQHIDTAEQHDDITLLLLRVEPEA